MDQPTARRSVARRWSFRALALLIGLLPLVLAELLCVACGWGKSELHDDPFVGFQAVHPLFMASEDGQRYEIAPSRYKFFAPDSFAATKPANGFRIFCLGGSTVQGRPYSITTSFGTFLELSLRDADVSRDWEVVNCGGISYASYRLVPLLEECLTHDPDLIILCTGHNEFLEDRTYEYVKQLPPIVAAPLEFLSQRRLFHLARSAIHGTDAQAIEHRAVLADDAEAMLDYHRGLDAFHRDDAWRAGIVEHFEFNLRRMAALTRDAGVPLILILPPSNLADQPPFKSQLRDDLTDAEREQFQQSIAEARAVIRSDLPGATERFAAALEIDDRYAATWYELGKCYEVLGDNDGARAAFVRARDEDVCPLRMPSELEAIVRDTARDSDVPLIDAHALLEAKTTNGILGDLWLIDHVHPTIEGHELLALEIAREMAELRFVELTDDWQSRSEAIFDRHVDDLPEIYFYRGEETLRSVGAWTRGEADGPPADERYPHRIPPAVDERQ